jgi:hypothetical protein
MPLSLSIDNESSMTADLMVNGQLVEKVAPFTRDDPITAALPPAPWHVLISSPSGRVLIDLTVTPGDVWRTATEQHGRAERAYLSCGTIDLWAVYPIMGGPARPSNFPPGDCA